MSQSQRILNLKPSAKTHLDWQFSTAEAAGSIDLAAPLPKAVDLRADWWPVGDQGQTGSCVGWAAGDGVMRYQLVKAQKLGKDRTLSVRFIWMASKEFDEFDDRPTSFVEMAGTSLKAALDVCRKYGTIESGLLPLKINEAMYSGPEIFLFVVAAQRKAQSYINMARNTADWKSWLASSGPVLVGLNVDDNFLNLTAGNAVLDAYLPPPPDKPAGHAVCLVGYREDGTFIVRNSWGSDWGDQGFAYVTQNYIEKAFYPESYGVLV